MQDLTLSTGAGHSIPRAAAANGQFFVVTGVGLVLLNFLTCGYHLTASNMLNVLSYAVAVLLIAYSIYVVLVTKEDVGHYKTVLVVASVLVGVSCVHNYGNFAIPDCLKYLSIYTFYVAGRSIAGELREAEKRCIYALGAMPLIFSLVSETKIYVGSDFPDAYSYFPNTNTAALYFSAVCFSMAPWLGNKVVLLQFINAAAMNKVGPAVATILAIGMWSIFPIRRQVLIAIPILGIVGLIGYTVGAFDRLLTGVGNMAYIWSLEPATVARLTYKQLIEMTGTTDLSAFFRIIHWTNIWDLYSSQGLGVILFGYGAGQTSSLTHMPVPAHNDYLRVLAEYGLFSFLIFVVFVIRIALLIKLHAARVLFTVLLIYFFSENLVDNFTSMALFFAYAGRFTSGRGPTGLTRAGT